MPTINRFADLHDEITAWRRDLHTHPELGFDVQRTAGIVAEKLREFGCDEVVEGIGQTGVVGVIRGRGASGEVIGLRADMDALPMDETSGVPHASKTPGKMHACGHDGHTAMLLGAAKYLAETRNFNGAVALIFQPAEEGGGGGREMVADGVMDRFGISEVYGMHNMPGTPLGHFAIRPGPLLAAADLFEIDVVGKGGHAALPHLTVDTTLAAAEIVVALQSIVSRNLDPVETLVISVASFRTDSETYNVIPDTVRLKGTVRTYKKEVQDMAEARMREVAESIARAFGATATLRYMRNYPATVNAEAQAKKAADVAARIVGEERVNRDTPPLMGAEDFSFMLNARPGAFIFIGNGDTAMVHHPEYDFNDEAIPFGCSYWAKLVEELLPAA
ncbi:M20 aminoacylase family protein [Pikeienuella sp. HZG-20]|uniref:M20 aminoacylase family protein n=1 Tax=Paludibacillus litoralis TaxID=3133267 RepID=UPI0030EF69ED